jgi:hypothetical protein
VSSPANGVASRSPSTQTKHIGKKGLTRRVLIRPHPSSVASQLKRSRRMWCGCAALLLLFVTWWRHANATSGVFPKSASHANASSGLN